MKRFVWPLIFLAGCGRLVDGSYLGDATLTLHGVFRGVPTAIDHPLVVIKWLGFDALIDAAAPSDLSFLPLSVLQFPATFDADLLTAPPESGVYLASDHHPIGATLRIGQFFFGDDKDGDGAITLLLDNTAVAPDVVVGSAAHEVVLFVDQGPQDVAPLNRASELLSNWQGASHGYHVVELDSFSPLHGAVVDNHQTITFSAVP